MSKGKPRVVADLPQELSLEERLAWAKENNPSGVAALQHQLDAEETKRKREGEVAGVVERRDRVG